MIPEDKTTTAPAARKFFIKTYGCQMNVYDSARMSDSLSQSGYQPTENVEEADLVLLNTCHIREKADEKLYSDLGRLRRLQAERGSGRPVKIGVTGCVAQAEGEEILRRAPAVDLVVGPQTYHRLPQILRQVAEGAKIVATDYAAEDKFDHLPLPPAAAARARGVSAFLTVQEGCDKFCTFCVVPYTRGAEMSRPAEQILREARQLVAGGVKELTLLGQNVNGWHGRGETGAEWDFGRLLFYLAKELPELRRLRYTTSHPRDMTDSLLAAHRDLPLLMPYLHLPVQSGSDRILKAMNRRHKADDYRRLVDSVRRARPDIALSGDFIVGFPGEDEQDFAATMQLVADIGYAAAYSFKYSPRAGTPGAVLPGQVAENVKTARLEQLQERLGAQQTAFLHSKIGADTDILLEKPGRHSGQMIGRSPWLVPVAVQTRAAAGTMIKAAVTAAGRNSLIARESGRSA